MSAHPYFIVVLASFALGWGAGFVMHRSDFCMTGMFRDLFLFRSTFMLRILGLLIVVTMVLFEGARLLGWLVPYPFPLLGPLSLASILGGLLFGIGMVLAGGCVVGSLYKMGAGSVLSAIAVLGLIAGSALYAEVHPWWAALARATAILPGKATLPQMLGVAPTLLIAPAAVVMAYALYRSGKHEGWQRPAFADGYLQPWKAALALSLIGLASYVVVGMPLGITTAYAKIGAFLEQAAIPDHVAALSYFKAQPLNYALPLSGALMRGGPGPALDGISAIQFPLILGIVLGANFSAVALGELRLYWRVPLRQYLSALAGGLVMGLAARMAPACNVWHLMGGLPVLAGQSLLFVAGLLPGAWLGTRLLVGVVLRSREGKPALANCKLCRQVKAAQHGGESAA